MLPKKEDKEEEEELNLESQISKALSDSITKTVVILVLLMLFILPIIDSDTWISDQIYTANAITLLLNQYKYGTSWLTYQNTVKFCAESGLTRDRETSTENVHPIIRMSVADPEGTPWNNNIV